MPIEPVDMLTDSIGRYSCIGRNLALAELRLVTANLILKSKIDGGDGTSASTFSDSIQDCFTARTGPFEVQFQPRDTVNIDRNIARSIWGAASAAGLSRLACTKQAVRKFQCIYFNHPFPLKFGAHRRSCAALKLSWDQNTIENEHEAWVTLTSAEIVGKVALALAKIVGR